MMIMMKRMLRMLMAKWRTMVRIDNDEENEDVNYNAGKMRRMRMIDDDEVEEE